MPTTLPGGHVAPPPPANVLPFTYPVIGSSERASQPPHAQMLVIAAAHAQGRDATSTALVPPTPYGSIMPGTPHGYTAQPRQTAPISRRTKLVLGGAALTMVAAVTTVIIIKTVGGGSTPAKPTEAEKTDKQPVKDTTPSKDFQIKPLDAPKDGKVVDDAKQKEEAAKQKAIADAKAKAEDDKKKAAEKTIADAKAKAEDDRKKAAEKAIADAKAKAEEDAKKKQEEKRIADADAKKKSDAEARRKQAEQADERRKEQQAKREADLQAKHEADLAKAEERKRIQEERKRQQDEERKNTVQARKDAAPKRVSTATSAGVSEAKENAQREYKSNRNFNGAAALLRAAAGTASSAEAGDLRAMAGTYEQFGKAFNYGMAPGTAPAEAFDKLRTARNFDRSLGGAYKDEIEKRLKEVAPKTAIYYVAKKDFDKVLTAVKEAESIGVDPSSPNLQAVRKAMEGEASRLYSEASAASPDEAKQKARQILKLVDPKSPYYAKAQKLLSS
jgi:hypothetical protein